MQLNFTNSDHYTVENISFWQYNYIANFDLKQVWLISDKHIYLQ